MRKVFAIVAALIGGILLWQGFKFGRVAILMQGSQIDSALTTMAVVMAGAGAAFMALGWWLFRDPRADPSASASVLASEREPVSPPTAAPIPPSEGPQQP